MHSCQSVSNNNETTNNTLIKNLTNDKVKRANLNIEQAKLYSDELIEKIKLTDENFSIKVLTLNNVDEVLELRSEMFGLINNDEIYRREENEKEIIRYYCSNEGITIGIYNVNVLVAYAILALPFEENAGNFARLRQLRMIDRFSCARLASCMVRPHWQGHGLHHLLLNLRLAVAKQLNIKLIWTVLSLKNPISRHNLFQSNFKMIWVGLIGGLWRQIMANTNLSTFHFNQYLPKNNGYDESNHSNNTELQSTSYLNKKLLAPASMTDAQLMFLHAGYIGCQQHYVDNVENILFEPSK